MVRASFFDKNGLKKGAWSQEEDDKLRAYVQKYGHWNWRQLPKFAGLSRCGKSCRLRWMNYLRPGVRHGNYSKQEEDLIIKLHEQLGNKWSIIASELQGRSDNEVKNYWHTLLKKKVKKDPNKSGLKEKSTENNNTITGINENGKVREDTKVVEHNSSEEVLIFENSPFSPEMASSKLSSISSDSALPTSSDINWIAEESSSSTFEEYFGDFWTQPFIADNTYNQDMEFMIPLFDYHEDSIDLLY